MFRPAGQRALEGVAVRVGQTRDDDAGIVVDWRRIGVIGRNRDDPAAFDHK